MSELAPAAPRSRRGIAREAIIVGLAILAYFAVRNITAGNASAAFANADVVLRVEAGIGLALESDLQDAVLSRRGASTAANWVYIWGHWPVILGAAIALYVRSRDRYYLLRNALIASGLVGFFFFALFPVAPPRLLDSSFVDTVAETSNAYRALQPPGLTNQYAAFPSLHAGWNLVVGIVVFRATSSLVVRALAVASPAAMFFAVVATANHYVLDLAGGVAVVLVGLAIAHVLARRGARTLASGEPRDDVVRIGPRRGRTVRRHPPGREPPRRPGRRRRRPARRG